MKKSTKYIIESGWQGCIIRKEIRGRKFPLWLGGVYRGRATWYCDYTPARVYTPKGAAAIVAKLERGEIE